MLPIEDVLEKLDEVGVEVEEIGDEYVVREPDYYWLECLEMFDGNEVEAYSYMVGI